MKTFLLLFNLLLMVMQCSAEKPAFKSEIWWINSAKVPCTGVGPMQCMQIQKGESIVEGKWQLFYDQIEGFTYEPGFIYQLEVETSKKPEPIPADASSLSFKLIKLLSKNPDPKLPLSNIWKLEQVGSIKDPKSSKGEALTMEINASQNSYFAETGCNSIRGSFSVEGTNGISFGQGAATMKACPNMEVEMEVKKVLGLIKTYKIENNILSFQDQSGQILMSMRAVD